MSRHAVGALATLALSAGTTLQAQSNCKINDGSPYQIASARNYVTMAANAKFANEVPKHLAASIKVLTDDPDKIKNEVGRQYLLLRTYNQILMRESNAFVVKRGELGFTKDRDGMHNILLAMDTAVNVIVASMPECRGTVTTYRDKYLSEVFNKAAQSLQDDMLDSATFYSNLAMQSAPKDPRPWNIMVSVYQQAEKQDSAKLAMHKVIELAGTDTLYRRIAQQHRYNLALLTLNDAEAAEGAAREEAVKNARVFLDEYLKIEPGNPMATQALGRALRLSGDTAAVTQLFKDMIEHPDRFTDVQLFEGASNAAGAQRDEDAAKLFEAGLSKNPYHRLGLQNAANVYFSLRNHERMGPVVMRLIEVDPNSQGARHLVAGYWQLRQRAEEDPAKKKAYADSIIAAIKARDELNPRVDIAVSSKNRNNYVLTGTVTNGTDKEASYTLKFELLDEKGQVVGTRDVPVGPIAGNGNAPFNVSVEAPKAVAFRYAPIK